jgi:hypothetical protein
VLKCFSVAPGDRLRSHLDRERRNAFGNREARVSNRVIATIYDLEYRWTSEFNMVALDESA